MRNLLVAAAFFTSASAFANPFDNFVGEYKVSGTPQIRSENAKSCNRFFFEKIVGLKVEVNTSGYHQSHILQIQNAQGWFSHPTMDFEDTNELKTGGSYAQTTGSNTQASNEYGTWGTNPIQKESLTVTLEKSGASTTFTMTEALYKNSALTAACHYKVLLTEK